MIDPTPEQIEAGARAIATGGRTDTYPWEMLGHQLRQHFMAEARAVLVAAAGATPQEPAKSAGQDAKVILRGSDSDCAGGVCPKGCSHLMWFCDQCSCEGGWGGTEEFLEALAAQHACPKQEAAPQARTSERCDDCGDKLDYVAGMDGNGCYPHCWRCWYKDHPVEIPMRVDEAKLAEVIEEHQPHLDQTGVYGGYCFCGEAAESHEAHLASVLAEWLRGGGQ